MEVITITAKRNIFNINLKELYRYRELLWMFAHRDIKVKYAQTFLSVFWSIIKPLINLFIFTVLFGKVLKISTGSIPYPLFALAGLSAWTYFNTVLSSTGTALLNASPIISKIYFPRIIIPLSSALVGLLDFIITLLFMFILMIIYKVEIQSNLWYLPAFMLITIMASVGIGIWVSALTVRYRDLQNIMPFLIQMLFYLTPVIYPAKLIPEKYLWIYYMNPLVGVVDGFRWSLLGGVPPKYESMLSFCLIILLFVTSLVYFRKIEKNMVDII